MFPMFSVAGGVFTSANGVLRALTAGIVAETGQNARSDSIPNYDPEDEPDSNYDVHVKSDPRHDPDADQNYFGYAHEEFDPDPDEDSNYDAYSHKDTSTPEDE